MASTRAQALTQALTLALAAFTGLAAHAQAERFDIARFQVEGDTLLGPAEVQHLVGAMAGPGRAYGDIQRAVDALQQAYAQAGYTTVRVSVPEQELTGGTVTLKVTQAVIGTVTVSGNAYFSADNIRASLPSLQPGRVPDLRAVSASVQLANDSPAKQVGVSLADGAVPGTIDAKVTVTDNNPLRVIGTLDNTGTSSSGRWRTGVALQHANLFDRDQVGTLAYTTSPDSPSGMRLALYSLGYRIPLYGMGDSIDLVYGKSSANSPASSPTLGGVLGFTGKGDIYGLRFNHFLGRQGEHSARLVLGIDRKRIDSRCDLGGEEVSIAPPTPPIAACVPYVTAPLSLTYIGQRESVGETLGYSLGLARNMASGTRYTNVDGRTDRYSYLTSGNRDTHDGFVVLRGAASWFKGLSNDWQVRLNASAQYANAPLVASEQFGLTGLQLVRGFQERAVAADSGAIVNAELYTPELAGPAGLAGLPGQLRLLAFYDAGYGANKRTAGTLVPSHVTVASMGVGARYAWGRNFNLRLDIARVNDAGNAFTEKRGDWRAHLSAMVAF
ncbi:ShlB/FhaC/HecB family hemolysin secretion/activation protein [Variovorax sp. H27-G14]|uniref:ShlB/FhaC/HecB family hemolysin secretion/activation protein n=1 Tax=Variovorax sp. H27-G14 TaxID=3111914 RepID=UPI0038FCFFEC